MKINGYNFIHQSRKNNRGGGVGFYIAEILNYQLVNDLSTFIPFTFECITIELLVNNKKTSISSIYRSPNPPRNTTTSAHTESFIQNLDHLLHSLSSRFNESYILLDSNINLLSPHPHPTTTLSYLETIQRNGFIQCILRATRFQNSSHSLIDHIITNTRANHITTGVVVADVSDHLPTFIQLPSLFPKIAQKTETKRNFSEENISKFKANLNNLGWDEVLGGEDVDVCYTNFWATFKSIFDITFPLTTTKFNRNFHKICSYMTQGLLVSRRNKIYLHKKSIAEPTPENIQKFKTFRNLYNKLVRASKKKTTMNPPLKQQKMILKKHGMY